MIRPVLGTILTLGWRPFFEPLNLHQPWHALLLVAPLVLAVAVVYKAMKLPTLDTLLIETLRLTGYIITLMTVAAVVLWVIVEFV